MGAGGNKVDGDFAGHVGAGAVYFCEVFAGEGSAADGDFGAVVVHDEFAAGESGVGVEAALLPFAGGVDVIVFGIDDGLYEGGEGFGGCVLKTCNDCGNFSVDKCYLGFAVEGVDFVDFLAEIPSELVF